MPRPVAVLVVILNLLITTQVFGEEKLQPRLIKIMHRNARDFISIVQPLLSPGGIVVADDHSNTLIVKDTPENLERIEAIVRAQDIPQPNISIKVQFHDAGSFSQSGYNVTLREQQNRWRVGIWAGSGSSESLRRKEVSLMVMSGSDGRISIGERIPLIYAQWFYNYALGFGYIQRGVVFQEVSTGFSVMPVARAGGVFLEIAPYVSYVSNQGSGVIVFREASTSTFVPTGSSVVIGSGSGQGSEVVRRIFGSISTTSSQDFYMILTPTVLNF